VAYFKLLKTSSCVLSKRNFIPFSRQTPIFCALPNLIRVKELKAVQQAQRVALHGIK
jgi:hypothetical protein